MKCQITGVVIYYPLCFYLNFDFCILLMLYQSSAQVSCHLNISSLLQFLFMSPYTVNFVSQVYFSTWASLSGRISILLYNQSYFQFQLTYFWQFDLVSQHIGDQDLKKEIKFSFMNLACGTGWLEGLLTSSSSIVVSPVLVESLSDDAMSAEIVASFSGSTWSFAVCVWCCLSRNSSNVLSNVFVYPSVEMNWIGLESKIIFLLSFEKSVLKSIPMGLD